MSRNRYVGSWEEPVSDRIALPFTIDSASQVLKWGASPGTAPFTHHDISSWCYRFWEQFMDVDTSPEIEQVLSIVAEVDCQWDLYLANTYSLEQLQKLDFDTVSIPIEWFSEWLQTLQTEVPRETS